MSQPSMPLTGTSNDPFISSVEQEAHSQAQCDDLFAESASDEPLFSSTYSDVLDDLSYTFDDGSLSHANSSHASTASTPDFSNYNFGQQSSAYPQRFAAIPHPYPFEQQQTYTTHIDPAFNHRPLPFRSQTNSPFRLSSQPPHGYTRRRSLSHNDVDRIVAPPNPTFMRVQSQTLRARSATPEKKSRSGLHSNHIRSSSHGRSGKNAASYTYTGRPLVGDMYPTLVGTPIGTPLHEHMEVGRKRARCYDRDHSNSGNDPLMRHMTDPTQLAHSRRIIEIGAMAVRNHTKLDPRLEDEGPPSALGRIIKKLDEVQRHLQQDAVSNEDALRGCAMIREALTRKAEVAEVAEVAVKTELDDGFAEEDDLEAPSKFMSVDHDKLFGGCLDQNDLMGMLMRENE